MDTSVDQMFRKENNKLVQVYLCPDERSDTRQYLWNDHWAQLYPEPSTHPYIKCRSYTWMGTCKTPFPSRPRGVPIVVLGTICRPQGSQTSSWCTPTTTLIIWPEIGERTTPGEWIKRDFDDYAEDMRVYFWIAPFVCVCRRSIAVGVRAYRCPYEQVFNLWGSIGYSKSRF